MKNRKVLAAVLALLLCFGIVPLYAGSSSVITQVSVQSNEQGQTVVQVKGTGAMVVRTRSLENPARVVLDFVDSTFSLPQNSFPGAGPIRGVRVGQYQAGIARIVVDLNQTAVPSVKSDGQSLTVTFFTENSNLVEHVTPSSPAPANPVQNAALVRREARSVTAPRPSPAPAPVTASAASQVSVEQGLLTVQAENQPLQPLLELIAARASVTIVAAPEVDKAQVSAEFHRSPLDSALREMLKNYDVIFFYQAGQQPGPESLKTVWVYPANHAPVDRFAIDRWNAKNQAMEQEVLTAEASDSQIAALDLLIRREGRQSLDVVLNALKSPSQKIRQRALYRALAMGVAVPEEILINLALNDGSQEVRYLALQALPIDPTLKWVADRAAKDTSSQVSSEAREILREYGPSTTASTGTGTSTRQNP